jgi:hypothetical protein
MTVSTMAERRAPEPKSASVRANHRLLAISGALGGVIGFALALPILSNHDVDSGIGAAMIYGPLPTWLAIAAALLWGVMLPIISWRWERVVDEHERQAYRDGAVAGFYVLTIGAPVWWLLSRGGLLPPVDAVALYAAFMVISSLVWAWRKYR